jgi:DNA polymerase-1
VTYQLITDPSELENIAAYLLQVDIVAVDTETTGLDPYTSKVRLLQFATPDKSYIIDCFSCVNLDVLNQVFNSVKPVKIFHNAKFDIKMLRVHFNFEFENIFDTMLASQIISAGIHETHNLKDVVKRYLNIELDKSEGRSDWSGPLSASQLEYAIGDVLILLPLREKLRQLLIDNKLVKVAKLEFDCCVAVSDMELNGCLLDRTAWLVILEALEKKHKQLSYEIQNELASASNQLSMFEEFVSININSPSQLVESLNNMGIPIKDSSEGTLMQFQKLHPVIEQILEYRGLQKAISSYGKNILEFINPVTGRIHADFNQLRADTGRFSCSNPNLQQIPATLEYRSCFIAAPGNKLITADYSQIELRILAELSQDSEFIKAFESGEDLHKATASNMFGVPIDQITKEMRTQAKSINFGLAYGRGAGSLANQLGTSPEKARELIDIYFQVYSGIKNWLYKAGQLAIKTEQSRTLSNRLRKYVFDKANKSEVASIDRQGKNTPIQGTSADIAKQALIYVNRTLKNTDVKLINTVHDEIILEAPEEKSQWAATILEEKMLAAGRLFIKTVPIVVDVHISDFWNK